MKLSNRITVAAIVLVIVTGSVLGLIALDRLHHALVYEDQEWSAAMAQAVAKAVTADTITGNKVAVRDVLLQVLESAKEVSYLVVVDFKGQVFASTFTSKVPAPFNQPHPDCLPGNVKQIQIDGKSIMDVNYPLIEGLDAHLHVGIHKHLIIDSIREAGLSILIPLLLITFFGSVIAIMIGQRISRPISHLSRALLSFGRGESDVDMPETSKADREIRDLHNSFRDMMTEQQRVVGELKQFRNVLDQTLDCVFMFRPDTLKFNYVNRGAMDQVGYSQEELLQMTPVEIKPDFTEAAFREMVTQLKTSDSHSMTFNTRHQHRDGHTIPVEIFLQYICTSPDVDVNECDDEQSLYLAIVRDISDRLETERKLRRLNEELEQRVQERTATIRLQAAVLEQIHDSVISTNMQGNVTGWNRGAELLFGYTADEAMGRFIGFVYPEDRQAVLQDEIIRPLQEQGEHETEVVMLRKDGSRFEAILSLSLLRDEEGNPVGMVGYSLDISDRKQAERDMQIAVQEAEQANQAKSDFLSRMSHELRTPLNAILGFSQILEQNVEDNLNEDELSSIDEILKAGRHLLELINEVLDMSRVESGHLQLSLENVALDMLVPECAMLIKPLADRNGIQINLPPVSDEIHVMADRMRLKQVILNLLSNAVKYNRRGGEVRVAIEGKDDLYRLYISDTGPGIPAAMQSRVFDPFDRLNADSTTVEGTGIGLTLAKRLMEYMGGSIGFDSEEGQGSTFWIELARGDGQPVKHAEAPVIQAQENDATSSHNVLYVEDNPANLRLVTRLLNQRGGISLYDAHTAELAMGLIRQRRFDLILLDIHLAGDEDGYDILNKLRAEPALRQIPVVAISANATQRDIQRGLDAGFMDYLTKPLDINRFYEVINFYLGEQRGK
jgi:PAS domain S-box-containing protein